MTPEDVGRLYPAGSFYLTTIAGRTGWWVALAQTLVGIPSRWTHAGIVGYNGVLYEAAPGGVVLASVADLEGRPHVVCDAPVEVALAKLFASAEQGGHQYAPGGKKAVEYAVRGNVVRAAVRLLGTPYSFLDYLALGLHHLAPKARLTRWARQRVQDSGHLICSAFVDRVFQRAGIHLYTDGRLHGDVTPSDLDGWAQAHGFLLTRGGL